MKELTKGPITPTNYDCPRTGKTEVVDIQLQGNSKTITAGRERTSKTTAFAFEVIVNCTGLATCGVKKTHNHSTGGSGSSLDWSLCPRKTNL